MIVDLTMGGSSLVKGSFESDIFGIRFASNQLRENSGIYCVKVEQTNEKCVDVAIGS